MGEGARAQKVLTEEAPKGEAEQSALVAAAQSASEGQEWRECIRKLRQQILLLESDLQSGPAPHPKITPLTLTVWSLCQS